MSWQKANVSIACELCGTGALFSFRMGVAPVHSHRVLCGALPAASARDAV
eukprot:CAMPEP_0177267378 /NCGR_PEP_ID=MMETSP0367-20130122/63220_1 /TAXON_ID=447022 ORGANISM="Scrippsiella hangoei-like, Strain SHHI-4" /NCGR_SAMPLE_ID=MMETSP0367 /ASSEMBLY_ACC=CAM_ASM_000362 /LENGTH=49 /DNA_ID=CAMNT_0018722879 /DNA_START=34 /DNA_END=183 /DNA_ORIENTATION=+